jgi:hypothetical protein
MKLRGICLIAQPPLLGEEGKNRLESVEQQPLISEEANMTPEELNSVDARLAGLFEIQVQLLESQTRRMDEFQRESQAAQKRHEETHQQMREEFWAFMRETSAWREESLGRLDLILKKLVDRPN